MRIQLLHPATYISPGNIQTARPTQPIGLAYVAAALRKAGHECVVLDAVGAAPTQTEPAGNLRRLGLTDEQILDRIDPDAPLLGISNMFSFNWPLLRELICKVKARYPDKTIVCGGEHFSGLPELSMRAAPIDYIVMGEGEEVATHLIGALDAGDAFDPATIPGVAWRRGDDIVMNPPAVRTRALDEIAWPAWDLFDMEAYVVNGLTGGLRLGRTVPILATRGCPYRCTYCSSPQMWTTRWYARAPEDVADEIELYVRRYRATNFPFQDLTMIVKKNWIVDFCNEIIRRKLDITWQLPTGTRCEVIDDEVAPLLWRSGCRWLCYAPESGSERTRKLIKKQMQTESLERAVDTSVAVDLHVEVFFVIGFPHDTADDMRQTVRMARRLARKGVEDLGLNFFFPIPSTELFESLRSAGRMDLGDSSLMAPVYGMDPRMTDERNHCEHLTSRQLTAWKYRILLNFYLIAWASHPGRVARIAWHVLTGRQTSATEKLLGERAHQVLRRVMGRRAGAQVATTAPRG